MDLTRMLPGEPGGGGGGGAGGHRHWMGHSFPWDWETDEEIT